MVATSLHELRVTALGEATKVGGVTTWVPTTFETVTTAVAPLASTTETGCAGEQLPVEVTVKRWPLPVTVVGNTLNPGGCEMRYGARPPKTITSAEVPMAHVLAFSPTNWMVDGAAPRGAALTG